MKRLTLRGTALAVVLSLIRVATSAEPLAEVVLWPKGAPGVASSEAVENTVQQDERIGRKVTKVNKPLLTVYKPAKEIDTRTAVVIAPGGGYNILALDLEGTEIAAWLNSIGVAGLVLQYRVPRVPGQAKHAAPLQDAQRALSVARQHADDWRIDPKRIGIMGFSAGGHLSAATSTNSAQRSYAAVDTADEQDCHPDFTMLIYPAYLTAADDGLQLADEIKVDAQTPPALLIHTGDDRIGATNSIAYYLGLRNAKVPGELHVFPTGGHGYGLRPSEHAVSTWPKLAERWLKGRGLLPRAVMSVGSD